MGLEDLKVFTTSQVAGLLGVSSNTIRELFDCGKLRGYRFPGKKHRYVPRDALRRFLLEYELPMPGWLKDG